MAINTSLRYNGIAVVKNTVQFIKLVLINIFLGRLESLGVSSKILLYPTPPKTFEDPVVDFRERIFLFLLKRRIREVALLFYGLLIGVSVLLVEPKDLAQMAMTASQNLGSSGIGFFSEQAKKLGSYSKESDKTSVLESYLEKAPSMTQDNFYPLALENEKAFSMFVSRVIFHGRNAAERPSVLADVTSGRFTSAEEFLPRVEQWEKSNAEFRRSGIFTPFKDDELVFVMAAASIELTLSTRKQEINYALPKEVVEKLNEQKMKTFLAYLAEFGGDVEKAIEKTKGE